MFLIKIHFIELILFAVLFFFLFLTATEYKKPHTICTRRMANENKLFFFRFSIVESI